MRIALCWLLYASTSSLTLFAFLAPTSGQVNLPEVDVEAPEPSANPVTASFAQLDQARREIFTPIGANMTTLDRQSIEALPQGDNQPVDKLLLQLPGVTQDSAASGDLHVRNEHANIQYRIDGILLPEGVSGFGQILETSFVGRVSLVDGVLPAEYGLRTASLIDIETRNISAPGGTISMYGGSHETLTPNLTYGGTFAQTEVFLSGRFISNDLGIENPTASHEAIHDLTHQGRFFGYASTLLDNATRLTFMTGTSVSGYQIPNTPGQPPQFTAFGVSDFTSSLLNETQAERNFYTVLALQRTLGTIDGQLALFSR
jgi:hypothetical protein